LKISIVIPILNEAATIRELLQYLTTSIRSKENLQEIIVVDGGSTDHSQEIVNQFSKTQKNITVRLVSSKKGRAIQLNTGAQKSKGNILYFLHADSYPPIDFDHDIVQEVKKGNNAGCFRMKFDDNHWWLRDQSQFITRQLFDRIGGYDENYIVYEDNELVDRLFAIKEFIIIPRYITTSARRYRELGVWTLQYHFLNIHMRRWLGASSEALYKYYKKRVVNQ